MILYDFIIRSFVNHFSVGKIKNQIKQKSYFIRGKAGETILKMQTYDCTSHHSLFNSKDKYSEHCKTFVENGAI